MRRALVCGLLLALACASAPRLADPDRSGVWGRVRLVPREGVAPGASSGAGSYGDRRLRDVDRVDYTRPGFVVVYLADGEPAAAAPTVAIRGDLTGARLEPSQLALGHGAEVVVANHDDRPHVVSCPAAGLLRRLGPGESLAFRPPQAGALALFLPDAPRAQARLFVAPGPFAVVDEAGRYAIVGVEPGRHRLHAWHPRFPPTVREVELAAGRVERVDLELGVGLPGATVAE